MPTPTLIPDLRAVRELLSDPDRWTQGAYARDATGHTVLTYAPDACRWCIAGACDRTAPSTARALQARAALARQAGVRLSTFNDTNGHPEVLALIDKAIAAAEAEAE